MHCRYCLCPCRHCPASSPRRRACLQRQVQHRVRDVPGAGRRDARHGALLRDEEIRAHGAWRVQQLRAGRPAHAGAAQRVSVLHPTSPPTTPATFHFRSPQPPTAYRLLPCCRCRAASRRPSRSRSPLCAATSRCSARSRPPAAATAGGCVLRCAVVWRRCCGGTAACLAYPAPRPPARAPHTPLAATLALPHHHRAVQRRRGLARGRAAPAARGAVHPDGQPVHVPAAGECD